MTRPPFDPGPYVCVPYASRGDARTGCDCWGLVRLVYREQFAIDLPPLSYADAEQLDEVAAEVERERARPVWSETATPAPGDVVLFRMAGLATHVGVVLPGVDFLHCLNGRASCVERLDALSWSTRVAGFYRWAA